MSAIVLDHAREALITAEKADFGKQTIPPRKGSLQGRKVIPIEFYLHVALAVIGGVAAIALSIVALTLPFFSLFAAVTACVLLCIGSTLAASFIHHLTPGKEVDSIIGKLYAKVYDLVKSNQVLKRNSTLYTQNIQMGETEPLNLLEQYKESLVEYVKKQDQEHEALNKHLKEVIVFFKSNEQDTTLLENLQKNIKKIKPEEYTNPHEFFENYLQNNHEIYHQFSAILPTLTSYTDRFNNDYKCLAEIKDELEISKIEIQIKLKALEEKQQGWNELSTLLNSSKVN